MPRLTEKDKAEKQATAQDLFFNTNLEQKVIAKMVGVTANTIGNWIDELKWKELKRAQKTSRPSIVAKILARIDKMLDDPNTTSDMLAKETMALDRVSENKPLMSHRWMIGNELLQYLEGKHPNDTEYVLRIGYDINEFNILKAGGQV